MLTWKKTILIAILATTGFGNNNILKRYDETNILSSVSSRYSKGFKVIYRAASVSCWLEQKPALIAILAKISFGNSNILKMYSKTNILSSVTSRYSKILANLVFKRLFGFGVQTNASSNVISACFEEEAKCGKPS